MAGDVQFYSGAEASGKGPGSTTPEAPKLGAGPVEFYDGAESVSGASIPAQPSNSEGAPPTKGSPVQSEVE